MTAVDTNVVVRLLTGDDARQEAAAREIFAAGPVWIAKTVVLETCWLLQRLYGFDDSAIRTTLTKLLGLKNVHAEDPACVANALALTMHGIDLADAMHLNSRPSGVAFVSFDKSSINRARRAGLTGVSAVSSSE